MMDRILSLEGVVVRCKSQARGCGGRITIVDIACKDRHERQMSFPGQHRLNKGEMLRVSYENNTGVLWAKEYSVLDDEGNVLYSSNTY